MFYADGRRVIIDRPQQGYRIVYGMVINAAEPLPSEQPTETMINPITGTNWTPQELEEYPFGIPGYPAHWAEGRITEAERAGWAVGTGTVTLNAVGPDRAPAPRANDRVLAILDQSRTLLAWLPNNLANTDLHWVFPRTVDEMRRLRAVAHEACNLEAFNFWGKYINHCNRLSPDQRGDTEREATRDSWVRPLWAPWKKPNEAQRARKKLRKGDKDVTSKSTTPGNTSNNRSTPFSRYTGPFTPPTPLPTDVNATTTTTRQTHILAPVTPGAPRRAPAPGEDIHARRMPYEPTDMMKVKEIVQRQRERAKEASKAPSRGQNDTPRDVEPTAGQPASGNENHGSEPAPRDGKQMDTTPDNTTVDKTVDGENTTEPPRVKAEPQPSMAGSPRSATTTVPEATADKDAEDDHTVDERPLTPIEDDLDTAALELLWDSSIPAYHDSLTPSEDHFDNWVNYIQENPQLSLPGIARNPDNTVASFVARLGPSDLTGGVTVGFMNVVAAYLRYKRINAEQFIEAPEFSGFPSTMDINSYLEEITRLQVDYPVDQESEGANIIGLRAWIDTVLPPPSIDSTSDFPDLVTNDSRK